MSYETKANPAKKDKVAKLEETVGKANGIIFTDFTGLTVAEINNLRTRFFESGNAEYIVAKNTLARLALTKKGYEAKMDQIDESLQGPTGMAIGFDDPMLPLKLIAGFAKETNDKPKFKGGVVDGEYYNVEQLQQLKDIPPIETLRAMLVGAMVSPLSGFVGTLNEIVRSFLGVLDAIIEKKKTEESAAA